VLLAPLVHVIKYLRSFESIVTAITANLSALADHVFVMLRQIPLLTLARMARPSGVIPVEAAEFIDERGILSMRKVLLAVFVLLLTAGLWAQTTCDG
jgi:hypothetical protein